MTHDRQFVEPPEGFRWASGGGSPFGDCNGIHVAPAETRGTICGRYGPGTLRAVRNGDTMCGSCGRVATARGIAVAVRLPDRPMWVVRVSEEPVPGAQDGRERAATANPPGTITGPGRARTAQDSAPPMPVDRVPHVDERFLLPSGEVKRFGDFTAADLRAALDAGKTRG